MALNNIKLNSFIVAELYRNTLIEINEYLQPEEINSTKPSPNIETGPGEKKVNLNTDSWKYLGENKKNILLIVHYENITHLPDGHLDFLTTVLSACKLNLGDVAILNTANHSLANYQNVMEKFRSSFVILFGLTPEALEMPLNFPEFQIQPFNSCTFLHTPDIEKLVPDKVLRSKLWVCLKKMLNLA